MAINIPIISDFADAGIRQARTAFDNFKLKVSEADGAMGKFRAGAGAALDAVKANAASFAAAGATAIATFAIRSVNAFKDLALEADRFASATGLAVEEASRWLEVAGDMEVSASAIETGINKMNRTLATTPNAFRNLGVEIAKTEDGATDANQTFLNVIERLRQIEDPAERARVGTELLGRGWQEMSQLIQAGSSTLSASLAEVSDAKVINQDEVDKAKAFREAMDNLADSAEDLSISVGSYLVPVITGAVEGIKVFSTAIGAAGSSLIDATGAALGFGNALGDVEHETSIYETGFGKLILAHQRGVDVLEYYNARMGRTTEETQTLTWSEEQLIETNYELNESWKTLLGTLDIEAKFRDAEQAVTDMNAAAIEAFADPTLFDAYKTQQDSVIRKFADILTAMEATDAEQNRIRFLIDTEPLEYALEALNRINLAKTGQIITTPLPRFGGARAEGGSVMAGTAYLVGERGPELFVPGQSGTVVPNGGSNTITVNVMSADPNEVVRALQTYNRNVGKLPVSVQ